jgi:hypothetical protein
LDTPLGQAFGKRTAEEKKVIAKKFGMIYKPEYTL